MAKERPIESFFHLQLVASVYKKKKGRNQPTSLKKQNLRSTNLRRKKQNFQYGMMTPQLSIRLKSESKRVASGPPADKGHGD